MFFNDSSFSFFVDGCVMAFVCNDCSGNFDFYYVCQENGIWKDFECLFVFVNIGGFEFQFVFFVDGNLFLFVSDWEGGFGWFDFWAICCDFDGFWCDL